METPTKRSVFIEKINDIYKNKASIVLKYQNPLKITSFRVNTLNSRIESVLLSLKEYNLNIQKGPFENSFYIPINQKKILVTSLPYLQGKIYVQEFSSMIPPLLFNYKNNENIADLCASPGSKTSQMASLSNNSNIVAVEKSKIRLFKLQHNMKLLNVTNVKYLYENAIILHKRHPEFINYFDKVLVDAPCSTESKLFLDNLESFKYWSNKKVKDFTRTQKGLILAGLNILKPGGELIYSTCTHSIEENELILDYVLNKFSNIKVENIDLSIKNKMHGISKYKEKELNPQIKNSVRILPNELFSGFFVARIKKI